MAHIYSACMARKTPSGFCATHDRDAVASRAHGSPASDRVAFGPAPVPSAATVVRPVVATPAAANTAARR